MDFSALTGAMNGVIFKKLGDAVTVDGRPTQGMFIAPWIGPKVGHLPTGINEPHCHIRDQDAVGVARGSVVGFCGQNYTVVRIEPDGSGITALILREAV